VIHGNCQKEGRGKSRIPTGREEQGKKKWNNVRSGVKGEGRGGLIKTFIGKNKNAGDRRNKKKKKTSTIAEKRGSIKTAPGGENVKKHGA